MKSLKVSCRINILDLFALLITIGIVSHCCVNDISQYVLLDIVMPMVVVYALVRLLYVISSKTSYIIMTVLAVVCIMEICIGLAQVLGLRDSNHALYKLTGSFSNPGPYGCFLAICVSLFTAYGFKNKESISPSLISKLSYYAITTIAAIAFIILPSTQSRSAILALGCSIIVFVYGTESIKKRIKPTIKKYGLWVLIGFTLLGTGAYLFKKPSADGRLFIDKVCIKAMCANGWKGAGIGHFGGAYGAAQSEYFKKQIDKNGTNDLDWSALKDGDRLIAECPDNAFNEYLFLGVELGPIMMLLFIGMIVYAIVFSFKRETLWCYAVTTFSVFVFFSYPLHVFQFQMLFPVLLASCVSDLKPEKYNQNKLMGIIMMTLILVPLGIIRIMKQSAIEDYKHTKTVWNKVERWHNMEYYDYILEDCESLFPYMKNDYHFLFAYGQSLNKTGNYCLSDSVLRIGTKLSSDPMFWSVMGNNSLEQGNYREAEEHYKHAFYIVPNRMYPLYLLAKLYYTEGDTTRFIDMANMVETFVPKVESANTERLRNEIAELKTDLMINSKQ